MSFQGAKGATPRKVAQDGQKLLYEGGEGESKREKMRKVGRRGWCSLRLCESAAEAHTDSAITLNVFFFTYFFFSLPSRLTLAQHATLREAARKKEVVEGKVEEEAISVGVG